MQTAIFMVFTNCIGWSTAATERFIIGNGSWAANKNSDEKTSEKIIFKYKS